MADYVQKIVINYTNNTGDIVDHIGSEILPGVTEDFYIDAHDFNIQDIRELDSLGITINSVRVETEYDIKKRVEEQMRRHREFMAQQRPTYECPF